MKSRRCLDCSKPLNVSDPAWKTRCRDCYNKHRNSLEKRVCEKCMNPFTGEAWKTMCVECFRRSKEQKIGQQDPVQKVYTSPNDTPVAQEIFSSGFAAGLKAAQRANKSRAPWMS